MSAFADLLLSSILVLSDNAKKTVFFVGDSSGEKDSVAQREKSPQAIDLEWRAIGSHKRLDKSARVRIVIVDKTITEIADPQCVFYQSKTPGRIEVPIRDQSP